MALVAALAVGLGACDDGRVGVRPDEASDYGRGALLEGIRAFAGSDRGPGHYRALASRIGEMSGSFDEANAELAERNLVFLALVPLEARVEAPWDEQRDALALTVWPTFLEVEPEEGESPEEYTERVCGSERPLVCRRSIPEYHPLLLSGHVWEQLKERARDALSDCRLCRNEPAYREAMDRIERHAARVQLEATRQQERSRPDRWPAAGAHARPWEDAPVFSVDSEGGANFRDTAVEPGRWRETLQARRGDDEVLGVHLLPGDRVRTLRQLAADARAAGFRELALQARATEYPYEPRVYRLGLGRGRPHPAARPRDVDTIQILVHMLEAALEAGAEPPLRL